MFKNYIEYLRDNPEGYWFKRKLYGWGWTPATKQGWLVILVFLISILLDSFMLDSILEPTPWQATLFFVKIAASVVTLLIICYKTGEKLKWQWGIQK